MQRKVRKQCCTSGKINDDKNKETVISFDRYWQWLATRQEFNKQIKVHSPSSTRARVRAPARVRPYSFPNCSVVVHARLRAFVPSDLHTSARPCNQPFVSRPSVRSSVSRPATVRACLRPFVLSFIRSSVRSSVRHQSVCLSMLPMISLSVSPSVHPTVYASFISPPSTTPAHVRSSRRVHPTNFLEKVQRQ